MANGLTGPKGSVFEWLIASRCMALFAMTRRADRPYRANQRRQSTTDGTGSRVMREVRHSIEFNNLERKFDDRVRQEFCDSRNCLTADCCVARDNFGRIWAWVSVKGTEWI